MKEDEFISKLIYLAKSYGWSGDYAEVCSFVRWVIEESCEDPLQYDLEPFE